MTDMTLDGLLALERRGWDALCDATGGAFYRDLMTPDALMVLVDGHVLDREAVAASLDGAPPWSSYELTEARTIPAGDGAVALVYRATARRAGADEPFVAVMTSLYRLVDGRPRLALYQQTTATH
ncbi:nuclear transport factor 2 family protein [Nocardioides sp. CPCC 205120]|uniref:nuclear transport factor 2 family protein n=1 Tax=Nocardioides sp. CPCC 205120 TaxID=3406462 RepID=UPI003B5034C1